MQKDAEAIEEQILILAAYGSGLSINELAEMSYLKRDRLQKILLEKLRKMSGDTKEYL